MRHRGFIPWDDDIDIIMLREDYRRFIELTKEQRNQYIVLSPYYSHNYYYPFVKVVDSTTELIERKMVRMDNLGVNIDIFPIDKMPANRLKRKLVQFLCMEYRKIMGRARVWMKGDIARSLPYIILCRICWSFGWKRAFDLFDRVSTIAENDLSECYSELTDCSNKVETYPSRCFLGNAPLRFEGNYYQAMSGYDEFLRIAYGDYMQLPPEDQRKPKHGFEAYLLD